MSQVKETYNINLFDIQGNDSKLTQSPYVRFDVDFTWMVSDCEELVVPPEEASRQKCD